MIGAVVLAAGEGSRFGGPKQLAELDGRPLLEHVLGVVRAVPGLAPVVVVLGAHAGYEPLTRGMQAALPYVDHFLAGNSIASLEELADLLEGEMS